MSAFRVFSGISSTYATQLLPNRLPNRLPDKMIISQLLQHFTCSRIGAKCCTSLASLDWVVLGSVHR